MKNEVTSLEAGTFLFSLISNVNLDGCAEKNMAEGYGNKPDS